MLKREIDRLELNKGDRKRDRRRYEKRGNKSITETKE